MPRPLWCLSLVAPLLACEQPNVPPARFDFAITPARQWSGGTITVRSTYFRGRGSLPLVVAGADTTSLHRIDDSTVAFTLPIGPSGAVDLALANGHGTDELGVVDRVGRAGRSDLTPAPQVGLVATVQGGNPVFLGAHSGQTGYDVVEVDPVTATSRLHAGLRTPGGYYGVGITYRPDRFLLRDSTDTLKVWQLWPTPQPITVPPLFRTGHLRLGAQMTDSTWLFNQSHWTNTSGPVSLTFLPTEDAWNLFVSPRGDRVAMALVATTLAGAPIFDTRSGDTAFTAAGIKAVQWAEFSGDGGTLYLLGAAHYQTPLADSIYILDATTGQRLGASDLPDSLTALTLARDPGRDLLFVQGYRSCGPRVLVYQASTLTLLGEMAGGGTITSCNNYTWSGVMAVDRVRQKLYLLWVGNTEPAPLWTFDLLP